MAGNRFSLTLQEKWQVCLGVVPCFISKIGMLIHPMPWLYVWKGSVVIGITINNTLQELKLRGTKIRDGDVFSRYPRNKWFANDRSIFLTKCPVTV